MCPGYLIAAAPIAFVRSMPTMLWYVHPSDTRKLRTAERLADAVVTALPDSYPRRGPKIHPIGHAIDVDSFDTDTDTDTDTATGEVRLLAVGRTSAVKGYETLIRSAPKVLASGVDLSIRIVGPAITDDERAHRRHLHGLIDDLALGSVVRIEDGIPPHEVPKLMSSATAIVNATSHGSADKVVFEAMAAARPVVTSNRVFDPILGDLPMTRFEPGDHHSLADRVLELSRTRPEDLVSVGMRLRERVREHHSLEHWADEVATRCQELSGSRALVEP